jgi:hypothetical protein
VVIGDYYYFKVGSKVIGKEATRVSMYLYVANKFYNTTVIRCFANSLESIMYLIAFNYFLEIKKRFNNDIAIFTFLITTAFMIRCTSPIGFLALIIHKMYYHKATYAFIVSGFLIAIPTIVLYVSLDTYYY